MGRKRHSKINRSSGKPKKGGIKGDMTREELIQLVYLAKKWNKNVDMEGYEYDEALKLWEDVILEMESTII